MRVLGLVREWTLGTGAALAALSPAGCAFVLDFDKYEACGECRDVDPCSSPNHACVERGCVPRKSDAECAASQTPGDETSAGPRPHCPDGVVLSEYRSLESLEADVVFQAEVLTSPTHIYHAAFVSEDGKRDVVLRAFDTTEQGNDIAEPVATLRLSELLEDALSNEPGAPPDEIVAPATMVMTPGASGALTLYTAIAAPGALTGDVVMIALEATWPERAAPTLLTDLPNFQIDDAAGRAGPAAGTLANGSPFVVWQGCKPTADTSPIEKDLCRTTSGGTGPAAIYGHTGSRLLALDELVEQGLSEDLPAGSIQALSGGTQPAAIWAVSGLSENRVNVRAGLPALDPSLAGSVTELLQCDEPTGGAAWLSAAPIWGPISSVAWTRDTSIAEATRVQCLDETCRDLALAPDAGVVTDCNNQMERERVFPEVEYLVHGVWADSNGDTDAYTVAAFTTPTSDDVFATVTQGLPDPNAHPLFPPDVSLKLPTSNPTKIVLSLQKYETNAQRATVALGWVEGSGTARLTALDLCLSP